MREFHPHLHDRNFSPKKFSFFMLSKICQQCLLTIQFAITPKGVYRTFFSSCSTSVASDHPYHCTSMTDDVILYGASFQYVFTSSQAQRSPSPRRILHRTVRGINPLVSTSLALPTIFLTHITPRSHWTSSQTGLHSDYHSNSTSLPHALLLTMSCSSLCPAPRSPSHYPTHTALHSRCASPHYMLLSHCTALHSHSHCTSHPLLLTHLTHTAPHLIHCTALTTPHSLAPPHALHLARHPLSPIQYLYPIHCLCSPVHCLLASYHTSTPTSTVHLLELYPGRGV